MTTYCQIFTPKFILLHLEIRLYTFFVIFAYYKQQQIIIIQSLS